MPNIAEEKVCEDRISALPEDLLVKILLLLPVKDAVATTVLSKPWRYIWTLMPKLVCKDTKHTNNRSFWWFLEHYSLQLHKAPTLLEHLEVKLGSRCPDDADVGKLILNAVERYIRVLHFNMKWLGKHISLPNELYTCKTLKKLILSNKILIENLPEVFLPSLTKLSLYDVVYKDEDSLVKLLSGCPVLKALSVHRAKNDNVIEFSVKVPSLHRLDYVNENQDDEACGSGSLIIDSPQLKCLNVIDYSEDVCLIEGKIPSLIEAIVDVGTCHNEKFLTCLSSVMFLNLSWIDETEIFCSGVNYSQLIECKLTPWAEYWAESIMLLLDNAPKLKVLMINTRKIEEFDDLPPWSWSHVPKCMSSQLEILEWVKYGGTRDEKSLLAYILANSKCLKRAGICMKYSDDCSDETKWELKQELKSMPRASVSSQLLFRVKFRWRSLPQHPLFDWLHSLMF
ncbi:unnamed protein product [Eruca vesicaria subsp. sativa]|uniref:FBD domain-containing protein n=1 Tax=Eruca vesicaria subsp. sativa TaxID=29727 RepID=A0ABC8JPG8_ERUVS|nr:unnamed protein product [Eruca vesicaria subsp. sativa]